jgi:hypothetical protein
MATATLIDTDKTIKPGVRRQRADGRQPTRSQVLDLAGDRDCVPKPNARASRPLELVRAALPVYR